MCFDNVGVLLRVLLVLLNHSFMNGILYSSSIVRLVVNIMLLGIA